VAPNRVSCPATPDVPGGPGQLGAAEAHHRDGRSTAPPIKAGSWVARWPIVRTTVVSPVSSAEGGHWEDAQKVLLPLWDCCVVAK
jgi:hypothetical protein